MGDMRRFRLMADLVAERFPDHQDARIADVAAGNGLLQAALRQRGYRDIVSFDRRQSFASGRSIYRYGWFDWKTPDRFDLIVGMHPDEGTDHIVRYGCERGVPWCVCPCCVRPSAAPYGAGKNDYWRWLSHLVALGGGARAVQRVTLQMQGRSVALVGTVLS